MSFWSKLAGGVLSQLPFGAALTGASQLLAARDARREADANARRAYASTRLDAERLRRKGEHDRARAAARIFAGGVSLSGSPLAVLNEEEKFNRADVGDILRFGLEDANEIRRRGRSAQNQSYLNLAGSIFSAFGD
ncbi:MAG: hypothetical protein QNJ84_18975 [Alphaproteobacteria bacterium]|nr:hypothetical protein [Alphaproteobacteria bacterium]